MAGDGAAGAGDVDLVEVHIFLNGGADDLHALINRDEITVVANPNAAFNPNDKTAVRNKK